MKPQSDVMILVSNPALSVNPVKKRVGITYLDHEGKQITILMSGAHLKFLSDEIETLLGTTPEIRTWTSA